MVKSWRLFLGEWSLSDSKSFYFAMAGSPMPCPLDSRRGFLRESPACRLRWRLRTAFPYQLPAVSRTPIFLRRANIECDFVENGFQFRADIFPNRPTRVAVLCRSPLQTERPV